jgi:hypothetical protein
MHMAERTNHVLGVEMPSPELLLEDVPHIFVLDVKCSPSGVLCCKQMTPRRGSN